MNEKWFLLSISQIEQKLKTNAASGLSRKAARSAWRYYYPKSGSLFVRKGKPLTKMIGDILADFALVLLLVLSVLAILFDDRTVGGTVLFIAIIGIVISSVCYVRCQRDLEQIDQYFLPTANVIRGGRLYRVAFDNIVPGDVILLEKGDVVCADSRIITSDNLSVAMRMGINKYIPLKKQAAGIIAENENNPCKHTNILHAGSLIEEGNARAIVFATGKYTYLGAITGGISEMCGDNIPNELKKMKKILSKISMISMLCILPFSMISLLFSHMSGGTATLSSAFLTALSLSASTLTQFSCTFCRIFFVKKIKELSVDPDPAIIRSADAFDKLVDVKYIFMLDGCAVTDGILHFDTAFNAEGEIRNFDNYTLSVSRLFEMVALYNSAESNALTLGVYQPDRFKVGMSEFLAKGNTDTEALKIRCPIRSYVPGTETHPIDRVFYTDIERKMVLSVCRSEDILPYCNYAVVAGKIQPLASVGVDRLRHAYNMHVSQGKTVLIFTIASLSNDAIHSDRCFVGAVVLREGIDSTALMNISALQQRGIKVISFVGGNSDKYAPEIPTELHLGNRAYRDDFLAGNYPLSYNFGNINTYYGFDENDIFELVKVAQEKGEAVGVIGFSEYAPSVISQADVFISCTPIVNVFSAKNEEELYSLEMSGVGTSRSCIQAVKSESDILISRPVGNKGGISALARAFTYTESAYRNLIDFFRYVLGVQLMRILVVALPMLFGKTILDARHVLLCSFLIDPIVLIMFASDKHFLKKTNIKKIRITSLKDQIYVNSTLMFCVLVAALLAVLLPVLVDFVGFMGPYLYQVEYLFFAMLWLNLAIIYYVRYGNILKIKYAIKNRMFMGLCLGIFSFAIILIIFDKLGLVFEMISHPLPYGVLSFVPMCVFILATSLTERINKK